MKAEIVVDMGNRAFLDYRQLPQILRQLASTIEGYGCCPAVGDLYNLHDTEGNRVGQCTITGD